MADVPDLGRLVRCQTCNGVGSLLCDCPGCKVAPRMQHERRCWDCAGTGKLPEGTSWAEMHPEEAA